MISAVLLIFVLVGYSRQITKTEVAQGYIQLVNDIRAECLRVSGAKGEVIDHELKYAQFLEDRSAKCFWKCIFENYHLIENGGIVEENIKPFLEVNGKEAAEDIFERCAHIRGSDLCEIANAISRCIYILALEAAEEN